MRKITAYNHEEIEKDGKPLITNYQFKHLCELLRETKDIELYNTAIATHSFVPEQIRLMNSILNPL